jgi:hypothetical protein
VKVKRLFSTAPDAKKRRQKGVTGVTGRTTERWIGRGWRVRSAHPACRGSSAHTDAFGRSRDRRVRSSSREVAKYARSIGRGGASDHDRPDAVTVTSSQFRRRVRSHGQQRDSAATGRCDRVRSVRPARPVNTQVAATCF